MTDWLKFVDMKLYLLKYNDEPNFNDTSVRTYHGIWIRLPTNLKKGKQECFSHLCVNWV